jgi:class 3 adenylate cyclase/tetratricopeptide (TPR) repeat protein
MDRKCPTCGVVVDREHKFCFECGSLLHSQASPSLTRGSQPIQYTPRQLVERIFASRDSMEGERKVVTVLFADIEGSTKAIEGLDPEEASNRFRPVLQAMLDGVHTYEGVVNRLEGDGIMALFGAPIGHEDHAIRACYSALAIRENLAALGEHSLGVRIGLNSGEVLVRSIGNDLSIDYDASGSTVHIARRMEQLATPGTAVLTEATRKLAEGFVNIAPLGLQTVKGVSQPVLCYALRDSSKARTRWEIRSALGLSRFVGRDSELAQLRRCAEEALGGNGSTIEIRGDAGIGKSRLVHELISYDPIRSSIILDACASTLTQNTPYWPITRLLRKWFAILEADDEVEIKRKASRRLDALGNDVERFMPVVESLLDVSVEDQVWKALDPPARRSSIQNVLVELVARGAKSQPVTLVFEDVQWFDVETLVLIRILSSKLAGSRVVVLLTCRRDPDIRGTICEQSHLIDLQPLKSAEARRLLESVAPKGTLDAVDVEAIVQRAGGTPLFVEEIARSLSANLLPVRATEAVKPIETAADMPLAIRSIMAARLDRLAPHLKHAVQIASVVGAAFSLPLISKVLDASVADTTTMMEALQGAHIVLRSSAPPDVEYSFFHSLMHEVAYGSLTQPRRQAAHLKIMNSLERLYGNRAVEHVETLEYHAAQSAVWSKAFRYACGSGRKALDRCAFEEARGHFEKALQFAERGEPAADNVGDHIDALLSLRNIYNAVGQYKQVYACLDKAEKLAVEHRHGSLASIKSTRCQLLCVNGNLEAAIKDGKAAVELASAAANTAVVAAAATILGWAYQLNGSYQKTVDLLAPHLPLISSKLRHLRVGTGTVSAFALGITAQSHAYLGQFADARRLANQSAEIAGETGHPYDLGISNFARGHVAYIQGDHGQAITVLQEGLGVCLEKKMVGLLPWYYSLIGDCLCLEQDMGAATDMLEKAKEFGDRTGIYFAKAAALISLGQLEAQQDSVTVGEERVRAALEIVNRNAYHGLQVLAMRALGDIRMVRRDYGPETESLYHSALKTCTEYSMRPEVAHIQFRLARLLLGRGERERSRTLLERAVQLYGQLEMPSWQQKAKRFQAQVPWVT